MPEVPSHQPTPEALAPFDRNAALEGLIANPTALNQLLTLNEAAVLPLTDAHPDLTDEQVQTEVLNLRGDALRRIFAPEGLAHVTKEQVGRLVQETEPLLTNSHTRLGVLEAGLSDARRAVKKIADDKSQATVLLHRVRQVLDYGDVAELAQVHGQIVRLQEFASTYGSSYRGLTTKGEENTVIARGALSLTNEIHDLAARASRGVGELEDEALVNPGGVLFDGIEGKIARRRSLSVGAHEVACQTEIDQNKQTVDKVRLGSELLEDEVTQLVRHLLHTDVEGTILPPRRLEDGIEELRRTIYGVISSGPQTKRLAVDALDQLEHQMCSLDNGIQQIDQRLGRGSVEATALREKIASLRHDIASY